MWRRTIHSWIRANKFLAILLIIVAGTFIPLGYVFTASRFALCPSGTSPFRDDTMPPRTVFQLVPPGEASLCMTIRISGTAPPGMSLTPTLGLYTSDASGTSWSACSNPGTNCGGATVSATPPWEPLPFVPLNVVVRISAPAGSTRGVYMLWFWLCSGGTVLWLRIGGNQTQQGASIPAPFCPLITYHVSLVFKGYAGMTPIYQNGTILVPP